MPIPLRIPERDVGSPDRVEKWLERLTVEDDETDENKSDDDIRVEIQTASPTTPPRRSDLRSTLQEEISPTNTSFSGQSIFDVALRNKVFGSPTPKCEIRDDESDATSVDGYDWVLKQDKECALGGFGPPAFSLRHSTPSAALESHTEASDTDTDTANLTTIPHRNLPFALPTQDATQHRPVWITSCLQCALASLPCSRTHPSCTRCKRHNRADLCLLQRRCFASEVLDPALRQRSRAPVLLKVEGEDEDVWKRKVELEKELLEKWEEEVQRGNWVLPDVGGKRGGWRGGRDGGGRRGRGHPGEGVGRVTFREMCVDVEE